MIVHADFFSILVYWGALLVGMIFCFFYQKINPKSLILKISLLVLICLPLSIIASIRYDVGTDYFQYINIFDQLSGQELLFLSNDAKYERGFLFLIELTNLIDGNNFVLFFFICEFLILFVAVCGFIKFERRINLGLAFFLYYLFYYHFSLNGIRQALAISFLILSYHYLLDGKNLKYLLIICVGSLFHISLLSCAIYPLISLFSGKYINGKYKKGTSKTILYYILLALFVSILGPIVSSTISLMNWDRFSDMTVTNRQFGLGTIFIFIVLLFPLLVFNRNVLQGNKTYALLRDLSILYLPISMIGYYMEFAFRLNYYTEVSFVFLVAFSMKDHMFNRVSVYYTLFVFFFFYVFTYIIQNFQETFPYRWIISIF